MARSDARMDMISSAIRNQAQQQAKEIIDKANNYRDTQLRRYEEQIVDEMYGTMQRTTGDLRQKMLSDIAEAEREAYHGMLRRREELTRSVFDSVAEKLQAFTATPEYRQKLLRSLDGWKSKYGGDCTVYLRPQDMGLRDEITALLPGCTVAESAEISIGGYVLEYEGAGIRVDETLETLLREQKPWFLQHCRMQVQ